MIHRYELLLSLLQRLSTVKHLTLLLAIIIDGVQSNHFIDGSNLKRNIISLMPHLCHVNFHIRSVLRDASHIEIDAIRQSFIKEQESVDCALEYFTINYGQCHIYSVSFIGTRLDFISNQFPLFDVKNRFSNVTILFIVDDTKPFESTFFERATQALPNLKILDVFNEFEQQEKIKIVTHLIEFPHLLALILHNIHTDYAEQLLCRSRLRQLVELVIRSDSTLIIMTDDNQQARRNCSTVKTLQTVEPWIESTYDQLTFSPLVSNFQNVFKQ